ncbi:MAG: MBL fold metallo-hydrolase [Acidobacteriota bacterium]|nr:MBL fold metallo-hydrolase [Acidobacteriota bacterium]
MAVLDQFDFEGLEGLRVGRFNRINTSCIVYRIEDTIIDTGPANQWRYVRQFLAERDIHQVLVTHHHEDHGGNCARIQKQWKPKILAHESGIAINEKGFPMPLYRRLTWGRPKRFTAEALPEKVIAGDLKLQVIHCPGHAPDLVCFLEINRGWLFTGDVYVASRPKFLRADEDPNEEINSLEHLLDHQFDTLFCAHRGIVLDGYAQLHAKLKYLITLREQVCYYFALGDSLREICNRILGKEEVINLISLGEFNKLNYIRAFAAEAKLRKYGEPSTSEELL